MITNQNIYILYCKKHLFGVSTLKYWFANLLLSALLGINIHTSPHFNQSTVTMGNKSAGKGRSAAHYVNVAMLQISQQK